MFCHQCGKEVEDSNFCPYCGAQLKPEQSQQENNQSVSQTNTQPLNQVQGDDAPSTGFAIISFLFPVVGIILFAVWNKDYPQKANSCLKGVIAGLIAGVVFGCCCFAAVSSAAGGAAYDYYTYTDFRMLINIWL
jgi:hypothetical protein